jgi:hypothetical protein
MPSKDFTWSKTRAQCPYCSGWFTRQGIQGHIRFRHSDQKKDDSKAAGAMLLATTYAKAAEMFARDGRIPTNLREHLLDRFLLDYLEKLARQYIK